MTLPCSRCCSVLIIWRALHPNLDHQRSLGQGRHGSRLSDIGVHEASAASSMCFDGKQLILYLLGLTQTWTWLESRWVQWQDMGPPPCLGTALAGDIKRQRSILFGASSFWASATSSAIARDLGVATLSKRSGWATRLARPAARKIRQRPVRYRLWADRYSEFVKT